MEQHERLRQYNRWRRGDDRELQPAPKELGELIEGVADRLEVLEREHKEFFERWHDERRKREAMALLLQQVFADAQAQDVLAEWWPMMEAALKTPNVQAQGAGGGLIAGGSLGAMGSAARDSERGEVMDKDTDREGFYEKMWQDFVSFQRGDATQICIDAARWRHFAESAQTALMLGSELDPNSQQDWLTECNKLADELMTSNALGEGRERGILREASSGEAATSTDGLGATARD